MHDYWQTVIGRQFAAAIQMLRSAVEACPDDLWDDYAHGTPFWHLAYHALFYADFYLSDDAETFQARDFHVDKANFLPGDYQQYGGVVTTPERPSPGSSCLSTPITASGRATKHSRS